MKTKPAAKLWTKGCCAACGSNAPRNMDDRCVDCLTDRMTQEALTRADITIKAVMGERT